MSINSNVANLSITVVKTLVKMAGFGFAADMIDGAQECLNLLADIKNDALDSPNAEMIRSLNSVVNAELDTIQEELMATGLDEAWIEEVVSQLLEAARATIKTLAEKDDALIIAVQQPEHFREQLRSGAAPAPDNAHGDMAALYGRILDCVAEEFLILAPWSANFDRVALTNLLRCFSALTAQIARFEQSMHDRFDSLDKTIREGHETTCAQNQAVMAGLHSLGADVRNISSTRHPANLTNEVWGSRPATLKHWIERDPTSNGTSLHDTIFNSPSSQPGSRCVLVGRAGSGKTSVAASIARRCESDKWSLVAWVDASTRSAIESGLIALGESVLCMQTNTQQDQRLRVEQVLATFRNSSNNKCLFVYDNVEGVDYLDGVLPDGPGVHVVVTTRRNSGWSNQEGWNIYALGNFTRDESVKLLISVTKDSDRETADKLASALGDLPLAVAQAAATCSRYYANLQDYYTDLQATNIEELLEPIEGGHYSKGAIASLQLAASSTLSSIRDPHVLTEAQTILAALCYLAESGVPTKWLKYNNGLPSRKAFKLLQDASIIDQSNDGRITSIHRLLAHALRTQHDSHITNDGTLTTACLFDKINNTQSDKDKYTASYRLQITHLLITQFRALGTQSYSKALFDHTQVVQCLFDTLRIAASSNLSSEAITLTEAFAAAEISPHTSPPQIARARNELARAHVWASRYFEAIAIYKKLVADLKNSLGREHSDTIEARNNLANAYIWAEQYADAIATRKEIVTDLTRTLGPEHRKTVKARNNLAKAYISAKQYADAIATHKEILADLTHAFGLENPDTIEARNNLAKAYISAKQYEDAIATHNEIVTDLTRTLGPEHPSTINARNNLADAYEWAKQYEDAIATHKEKVSNLTRTLGPEHPSTIKARKNLASAYERAKQYGDAIATHKEILADLTRTLGPEHPSTIEARINLADAYIWAEQYADGIATHKEILVDLTRTLGPEHPSTVKARKNLASAYEDAKQYADAIATRKEIVAYLTHAFGLEDPDTIVARINLANAYKWAEQYADAIATHKEIVADLTHYFSPEHPSTIKARNDLAYTYEYAKQYADAIATYNEIVTDLTRTIGPEHPSTIEARINLAYTYEYTKQYADAIATHKEILADLTHAFGLEDPDTIEARNNLANAYKWAEQYADAIATHNELVTDLTRTLGPEHPSTIEARNNLANAYECAGDFTEAITLYQQILTDRIRILGNNHPDTLSSRNNLAGAYESVGRLAEAVFMFEQVLTDRIRILGNNHPDTLTSRNNLAGAYESVGRLAEAVFMFEQVLTDRIRILGNNNPNTLVSRNNLAYAYYEAGLLDPAIQLFEQTLHDCIRVLVEAHPFTATVRENLEAAKRELEQQAEDSANEEREQED